MTLRDAPSPALLDAFWRVVARYGWHGTTFARVAEESGETLSDLRALYPTPVDLLRAHARAVDVAVLEGTVPHRPGFGSARDRVFDLLMRRLDALAPHREGVLRMQRDLMRDPLSVILLSPILMASMAWTLEGAGVSTAGLSGALRVQGLAGVWVSVARAWAGDESADLGATMAALDRALDRAERVARALRLTEGEAPGPVDGADALPPDVVDPPLADTGIMVADAASRPGDVPPGPTGPLVPVPPSAMSPEAPSTASPEAPFDGSPGASAGAPLPSPPRKPGGPGDMSVA